MVMVKTHKINYRLFFNQQILILGFKLIFLQIFLMKKNKLKIYLWEIIIQHLERMKIICFYEVRIKGNFYLALKWWWWRKAAPGKIVKFFFSLPKFFLPKLFSRAENANKKYWAKSNILKLEMAFKLNWMFGFLWSSSTIFHWLWLFASTGPDFLPFKNFGLSQSSSSKNRGPRSNRKSPDAQNS